MKGVVACGNRETARAAVEILSKGGNAFDAAVGAALAAAVAECGLTGLAGGGYALAHQGLLARTTIYDFFVNSPGLGGSGIPNSLDFHRVTLHFTSSSQDFFVGAASVAVPGTPLGLKVLKEDLGRLPWEEVVAPAVRLAREGFVVDELQAACFRILAPIFIRDPLAREMFYPEGGPPEPGVRLRNPLLADFLEAYPQKVESLYRGELARRLVEFLKARGGLLTLEDLAFYHVYRRRPLKYAFSRGHLFTGPPPSFGGSLVTLGLKVFEEAFEGGPLGSFGHLQALSRALKAQAEWRNILLEHPEKIYTLVGSTAGTTHLSVADNEGNLCGITLTFGEGAGLVFPETGLMLNNILGEEDLHPRGFFSYPPGRRIPSMMAPSLLFSRGRRYVFGSGGSKRIRSALLQVAVNLAFLGLSPAEAVSAPRLHYEEGLYHAEPGLGPFPEEISPIKLWSERNLFFGGVHLVADDLSATGDPRRVGVVLYA
ncbi:gamma-glutamyltransferase [Thermosulfurimonas marina]|uniref:Gamma-glutamyltransferase n=1 Tax=Thermosulfurimonas marina TaxID=2047767 RepID=A0A6H1WQY2_9BACT|nr:gamma-glutamyltransferase [Thermosulfurimonas marina]QJA05564.1 gamma-glutamyltransferase [Thermosulfurimonas marina]